MSLKKERKHACGFSNIDFRTKRDIPSMEIFQPWKTRLQFGTMGYSGFHLDPKERDKLLSVTEAINNTQTLVSEIPDPRYFKTAQYYKANKIDLKKKSIYTNERVAQLDESYKGKERFMGDSMMISDLTKFRKTKRQKKGHDEQERERKILLQNQIIKDKTEKNKEAYQETQLVNIDAEVTLEHKVDINKLLEIRLALRRRYANRTNFRKIFKEWDNSIQGEISVYDAHSMINKLAIPINYNETRALLSSSNTRDCETINMEEFMHLIFSDNPALNVDLKKLKYKEEKLYDEGLQTEMLKKNMKINIAQMAKTDELNFLRGYLRTRIPKLASFFNEDPANDGFCDFEALTKVMKRFPIPEKYTKEPIMKAIYDGYLSPEQNRMNYKKFIENLADQKELNDFFNFKEKYLEKIEAKITRNKLELQESIATLQKEKDEKIKLKKEILNEIAAKRKLKASQENEEKNEVNISQPSTGFINKVFANKDYYFKQHNELEKSFSAHPSLLKEIQAKTRYGANPPHQNTFPVIQAPENAGTYISERDRFNIRRISEVDFLAREKEKKKYYDKNNLAKIRRMNDKRQAYSNMQDYLHDEKDTYSQLQRTIKLHHYENINKMRNDLIE